MVDSRIIEVVEESKWINPMVVQDKKTGEVRICANLIKLNDVCMNYLSSTPFPDEVLEVVPGQEIYSFMDGFSSYHQMRITKEDCNKTIFVIEWGYFWYTMMPFGLKNVPTIWAEECAYDIF